MLKEIGRSAHVFNNENIAKRQGWSNTTRFKLQQVTQNGRQLNVYGATAEHQLSKMRRVLQALFVGMLCTLTLGFVLFSGRVTRWTAEVKSGKTIAQIFCRTLQSPPVKETYKYVGKMVDGIPQGEGKLVYPNCDEYQGEFEVGVPRGKGEFISFAQGSRYVGDLVNGKFQGEGTLTFLNNDRYEGSFVDGKFHGQGVVFYDNGDKFTGEFEEGNAKAGGAYVFAGGYVYVGDLQNGKPNGQGRREFPNGSDYYGGFRDGKLHGEGVLTCRNGGVYRGTYRGTFANGSIIQGTWNGPNGVSYRGQFLNGKCHGQGVAHFRNGVSYRGQFRHGLFHGRGVRKNPGHTYQGNFENGRFTRGIKIVVDRYDQTRNQVYAFPSGFYLGLESDYRVRHETPLTGLATAF